MPAIFKTSDISSRRFDPWHYQPDFQAIRKSICSSGRAENLSRFVEPVRGVTGGSTPLGAEYQMDGSVHFYRTTEIRNMRVCHEKAVYISDEEDETMARSRLAAGDVILTITGANFGESAVVEEYHLPGNISQHSVRFGLLDMNPYFLVAYLGSHHGQSTIWQNAYGATRPAIDYPSIRELIVPFFTEKVQLYIGNKVRQAERFRETARLYVDECIDFIRSKCAFSIPETFQASPRRVGFMKVSEHSLGPDFTWAMEGQSTLKESVSFAEMKDSCYCGDPIRSDERRDGPYPYYGASGPIDSHDELNFTGEYLIVAQDGSIGLACVARGSFWANNHVWVVCLKPEFDPDVIALYLTVCYPFWKGIKTGSVVPKVTSENLMKVVVPIEVATARHSHGNKLRTVESLKKAADNLTKFSKAIIESLIDKRLEESEVLAAQEALERGDNTADRVLLSRLTRLGLDKAGEEASFDDLDALYALLAQTDTVTE